MRLLLGEALRGLRSEPAAAVLSVIVVGLALYMPAMLYLASRAGELYSKEIRAQVKIRAYIQEDADGPFDGLVRQLETVAGIRKVTFRSRDDLLEELEEDLGEGLLAGLPGNPLPRAIDIQVWPSVATERGLDSLAAAIGRFPGIDEVAYGRAWAHRADRFFAQVQFFLGLVTILLSFLVLAITANIIRLIIRTRREAVGVWLLLGASPLYARVPYYVEGILTGTAGALVSLGLLFGTYRWLHAYIPTLEFFTAVEAVVFVAVAIGVALFGAILAARRRIVPL